MRLLLGLALAFFVTVSVSSGEIVKCKVESCGGWRLNRLPEVKKFLNEDFVAKYQNTEYKKVPGKAPEMFFLDENDEVVEKLNIEDMKRDELNKFIQEKGIKLKEESKDEEQPKHDEV